VRVFLDTNVLVSAFATRGLCGDVMRVVLAEHQLVTCEAVLGELERVLKRRLRLPVEDVRNILSLLRECTVAPTPGTLPELPIRDPDDVKVVASALAARVDILVTGDQDILSVRESLGIRVTDPRGFWAMLKGGSAGRGRHQQWESRQQAHGGEAVWA